MEPTYTTEKKSSKMPLIIMSLLSTIFLASAITLGILYVNEKDNDANDTLQKSSQNQNAVKKTELVEPKAISLFEIAQSDELYKDIEKTKSKTTYTAKVGRFTLQLPNSLGVIQKMDGGGEGSIETHIQVGVRDGGLIALPAVPFEIRAIKNPDISSLSTSSDFKGFLRNYGTDIDRDSLSTPAEENIEFADNKAFKYVIQNAFFEESYVLFQRGDIVYIIHTDVNKEAVSNIQKIVESNISFN